MSETLVRITPELVRAARAALPDWKLMAGATYDGPGGCACPVALCAVARGWRPDGRWYGDLREIALFLSLDVDYAADFANAYDDPADDSGPGSTGRADGRALRDACPPDVDRTEDDEDDVEWDLDDDGDAYDAANPALDVDALDDAEDDSDPSLN